MSTQLVSSDIRSIVYQQRQFFNSGKTKAIDFRIAQLKRLKQAILDNEAEILAALKADLNKPEFEAYSSEVGVVRDINYALKHIKAWTKPQRVSTPLELLPGSAQIYPEPLGVVLIISPWNYPFQLMIAPLVGAIAAGNCSVLKPSEIAVHTSKVVVEIIQKNFDPAFIAVVEGGIDTSQQLLAEKFDHIFFTGSTEVGKAVMAAAAKHLTPVTLELGGKSPCIVDVDVQVEQAAKRIAWGKFINAGQTCIAPDYLLVHQDIKTPLLKSLKHWIEAFYTETPATSPDYARIINQKHFSRLTNLLQEGKVVMGGATNAADRYIAPTVIDGVTFADPIMQDEIFGPILPVIEYTDLTEAISLVNTKPKPLALYFFSTNKQHQQKILQETSAGGTCINDTIMQIAVPDLPFGGVGASGMGSYRGKAGFDTFSHYKSVFKKPFWLDLNWRYAPYQGKLAAFKKLMG